MPSIKNFSTKYLVKRHLNIREFVLFDKKNPEKKLDEPTQLYDILANLPAEEHKLFILQEKDQITDLIKTALDLNLALQFLTEKERNQLIFEKYKNKLAALIQDPYDLKLILQYLSESARSQLLFEEYKYHIAHLIKQPYDLNLILQSISEKERKRLFREKKDPITHLIKTALDFNRVLQFFPEAEKKALFQQKKEELNRLIKTALDLKLVLQFLPKEERRSLLQEKKDDLIPLIETPHDLNLILQCLPAEEYTTIYESIKNRSHTFRRAFLDSNYCFIGIDFAQHLKMYHLLFEESLAKIRRCLDQISKKLNLKPQNNPGFENKNKENCGDSLDAVLEDLRNIVNQEIWHKKGISFFGKKIPDGIKKIINVLDDINITQIQKLKKIQHILVDKCANDSIFRARETHELYKSLYIALQPCTPYEYKQNKIR